MWMQKLQFICLVLSRVLEDRERQLFRHSPETELPSQPGLQQLHDGDNTFSPWGRDKRVDCRPRDHGDVDSLTGFNSRNNILDPQGDELFHRNGFVNRGNPQAFMGLPEPHSESSSTKEGIKVLASREKGCKAEAVNHTPPMKRWRFGNLRVPVITCSTQFEEEDSELMNKVGKTNENPDTMPFWSFEENTEIRDEREVNQDSYGETTEKFEFNSVLFRGVTESSGDVCKNGQNEAEQYSRLLEDQSYLKEMLISRRESQEISLVLSNSCHHSATSKMLTHGSHLPVPYTLVSLRTSDFHQFTEDKEEASTVERGPAEVEHVCYSAGRSSNTQVSCRWCSNTLCIPLRLRISK